jgi:cobaltochelatase CobS
MQKHQKNPQKKEKQKMTNLIAVSILSSNVLTLKDRGLQNKDSEISIAVKKEDLIKGVKEPVLYAYRFGMIYDPKNEFKPNVQPNHKLPDKLIEEYFLQLESARKKLAEEQMFYKNLSENKSENTSENIQLIQDIKKEMVEKNLIIDELRKENEILRVTNSKKDETENTNYKIQFDRMENMIKDMQKMQTVKTNRIEIKIGDKSAKIIEKVVHEKFAQITGLIAKKQAVYMYGSAGTGKSALAEQIADALELEFYPASTITQEFKLTGYKDASGNYHETNFYKAMKTGGIFFLDEMDSCSPDVLVGINGALANGYFDFPNETVRAHENFRVIAAGNTIGRGGDMNYTGRFALDISTLDRFWAIKIDYSPAIDKAVAKNDMELVDFAQAIRKASEESGIMILMSYRSLGRIAEYQDMFSLVEIMDMAVIKGIASDDIRMLARNMNIDTQNKYYKAFKQAA